MKKYLSIILLCFIFLYFGIVYKSARYKAENNSDWEYTSDKDIFKEIDKEHEWIVDPDCPGVKGMKTEEISYMYHCESDTYGPELTYSEHSYCAKCGFDYTLADREVGSINADIMHDATGCTWGGRVTGYYYITVDWPAKYVCKKCNAAKSFVRDSSQDGMYNMFCIQNKEYDKIVWYITGRCTPPSPTPSPTTVPTPTATPSPTPKGTTIEPVSTPSPTPGTTPKEKIEVGDTLKSVKGDYKVTGEKTVAFDKCNTTSSSVTISDAIDVDGQVFNITSVSKNAFSGNKKLKSVTIGKNVTELGNYAFKGCTSLKTVKFKGKKLKKIGVGAFKNCKKLKSITLSSTSLKTISTSSFYGCKNLKTITIKSKKVTFGKNSFKGIYKKATFKVPKSKLKTYKKNLLNKAKAPSKVKVKKN